jgi:hypothetical protein
MVARIFCWEPDSGLDPSASDLERRLVFLLRAGSGFQPSPKVLWFADALAYHFPDRGPNAVWMTGPLRSLVTSRFIELTIPISRYDLVVPFVTEMARKRRQLSYVDLGPLSEPLTAPLSRLAS